MFFSWKIGDRAVAVTGDDTAVFVPSIITVGGAGNITVRDTRNEVVTFAAVAGQTLPVLCIGVNLTGLTATGVVRTF
jgi:hypothetical protein